MSTKYKCPICYEVHNDRYDATKCMKDCVFAEYGDRYYVIEIDTIEYIKEDIEDFVGKCGTCRNCNSDGKTFSDCPRSGVREPSDACDTYMPATLEFGTLLETLWNEMKEAV